MNFQDFVLQKLDYFISHFKRRAVLLSVNGDVLREINLSFSHLSDAYLDYMDQYSSTSEEPIKEMSTLNLSNVNQTFIKISDSDLNEFWNHLDSQYDLFLNLEGQNIGDQTILKLSQLYLTGKCTFRKLRFGGNHRLTGVGIGKLGKSLNGFSGVVEIDFHGLKLGNQINRVIELIPISNLKKLDIGELTNSSLKYLSQVLRNKHQLETIALGEDLSQPWNKEGKSEFQATIRRCEFSKQILAINLYPENIVNHYQMISELNILCKKNRALKIDQRQNQFKAASLNPHHGKYYEPDNHNLNAYKFSVKSYLTNVFGSLLDEALYFLQKQRRNSLRNQAIFNVTKQPISNEIMQDICTSDGSIMVLTKYLLNKIKEDNQKQ